MSERVGLVLVGCLWLAFVAINLWGMVGAIQETESIGALGVLAICVSVCCANGFAGGQAGACFEKAYRKGKEAKPCSPT